MTRYVRWLCDLTAVAAVMLLTLPASAQPGAPQLPGRNVNMVSGTSWPGGDPFLQRQNEPSIAIGSANPQHLMGGANDYRTTDLELNLAGESTADAWLGVFKSLDGGLTWKSTLLPGCPYKDAQCQEVTPSGSQAVLNGQYQFASDPTVRAGTHGWFYFSGIAANRARNTPGVVLLARYYDYDNQEANNGDPIAFLGNKIIDSGTSGQFLDKPWLVADTAVSGPRTVTCTVPAGPGGVPAAQNITSGRVYLAYSKFTGSSSNVKSQILVATSNDCGATWGNPIKVSESNNYNLGTNIAIDAESGNVYLAWRRIASGPNSDAILVSKSTDFGNSWTKGNLVANINPFDLDDLGFSQGGIQIRNRTFPAIAVSSVPGSPGSSLVHIAWTENGKGPGLDARIMLATSTDGVNWPAAPVPVDDHASPLDPPNPANPPNASGQVRGHQFMPALSFNAGKLMLVYYDLRNDSTVGVYTLDATKTTYIEKRQPIGNLDPANPSYDPAKVFTPRTVDPVTLLAKAFTDGTSGLKRRHIVEVRALFATPGNPPVFGNSQRISKYAIGYRKLGVPPAVPTFGVEQIEFNAINLPMFKKGTLAFLGDYIDLTSRYMKPSSADPTKYVFNDTPSSTEVFQTTWTDNRDVRLPADGNWAHYVSPVSVFSVPGAMSVFDPTQVRPLCTPGNTAGLGIGQSGDRNQNIYTQKITQGLALGALTRNKPNVNGITRAFVVFVQNAATDMVSRNFAVTLPALPLGSGSASFDQFKITARFDMTIRSLSTDSHTVLVTPPNANTPLPSVTVNVCEITNVGDATCKLNGLQGSVVLNAATPNQDPGFNGGEVYDPRNILEPLALTIPNSSSNPIATPNIGVPSLSGGDPTLSGGDPTLSGGDPTLSGGDPTLSGGDPTLSGGDPSLSGGDPTLAGGDPTLSGGDPTLSGGDPTLSGGDPTITDVTFPVSHGGNASTSFTVKQIGRAQLCCPVGVQPGSTPPGFVQPCVGCILFLHKIYSTPTVQSNSCSLVVQTQNVVISSTPNPSFTSAANIGTPIAQDPTLPLQPQSNGYLTLRTFSDGQPTAGFVKNLVGNALKPVSVAQSYDTTVAAANVGCGTPNNPPCPPPSSTLAITLASLPNANYRQPFSFNLTGTSVVIGGVAPLTWSLVSSTASGLSVGACSGIPCITGTPTAAGSFTLRLHVVDSGSPPQFDEANIAVTVNPAPLTITALTNTKPYDGNTSAATPPTVSGLQGNDTVTGAVETYDNKNAGANKTLTVTAYTVNDGNGGHNYTVTTVPNNTGLINPAALTITATTNTKTYDATTTAAAPPTPSGLQGNDTVTGAVEIYDNKNAGANKTLTVTAYTVNDGNGGHNYTVTTAPNNTGLINPAALTITATTNTKTYDATTTAAAPPTPSGLQGNDTVTGAVETYDNKNAGGNKTLTVTAYTVNDGNGGHNYTVTTAPNNTGVIIPAALTITAATNTKTYDATTTAAAKPTPSSLQGSDTVTGLAETYDTPNAGTGKILSVSAYTINDGNNGGNYIVTRVPNTTGVVNRATASITVTGYNVIYDGRAHTATGRATGVNNVDLSADLNLSGTTHTNVGTYNNDPWTFNDPAGNYNPASGAVNDAILWTFTLTPLKSSATLGSAVPIIWTLQDASGNAISSLSTLVKLESVFNGAVPAGGCVASLSGTYLILYTPATGAKGNSSFRYVPPFQFNWDTGTVSGTGRGCYTVKITLNDGTAKMTNAVQLN